MTSRPRTRIASGTAFRRQGNEEFRHNKPPALRDSAKDECAACFNFGSDLMENLCSECEDAKSFYAVDEEDLKQMNFITGLFDSVPDVDDTIWEVDSGRSEHSNPNFRFGSILEENTGLVSEVFDFASDSEEFVVNSGFVEENDNDCFTLDNEIEREEFEWEELSERVHFDGRERLDSVSPDVYLSEAGFAGEDDRNIEWEILTTMHEGDDDDDDILWDNLPEDYIFTMEYDAILDTLVEDENAVRGSPPAAISVVKNLPFLLITKDKLEELDTDACAVCKDEITVGMKVTKMPCCHLYHCDCISQWLKIRNTCPVCRFELPTDNAEYERKISQRGNVSEEMYAF